MGDQAVTDTRIESNDVAQLCTRDRGNPLLKAAHPLLALACRLKIDQSDETLESLESLRQRLRAMVTVFDETVLRAGVDERTRLAARYCLCTCVDEIVAATPPGRGGAWASGSLLIAFHAQASGGERFFSILDELSLDASGNLDVLELLYVMLALGMQGRYRLLEGGEVQLETVRDTLRRLVIAERGRAPAWPGAPFGVEHVCRWPARRWVSAAVLAGVLAAPALLFLALQARLRADAQPVIDTLARVRIASAMTTTAATATADNPTAPAAHSLADTLSARLSDDLAAQRLAVDGSGDKAALTLGSDALFASGSAKVPAPRVALLRRIGAALRGLDARIVVIGHTDDQPPTPGRPSNSQLSLARATAVVDLLSEEAGGAERFLAQGRGASEPVAPNDTPENRARNRRVVITVSPDGAVR
jgi:type VI secretion system protein ImpK